MFVHPDNCVYDSSCMLKMDVWRKKANIIGYCEPQHIPFYGTHPAGCTFRKMGIYI